MKKCKEVMDLMSPYIDGELDKIKTRKFKEHISTCAKCKEELKIQMKIINLCNDIEDVELPESFNKQLHERLTKEKQRKSPLLWLNSKHVKLVSSIAAIFILVFITSEFLSREKSFDNHEMVSEQNYEIYTEGADTGIYIEDSEESSLYSLNEILGEREDGVSFKERNIDITQHLESTDLSDITIKVFIVNKFLKLDDMSFIVEIANKLDINIVVEGYIQNDEYILNREDEVLVKFTTKKNKYDSFVEELKNNFINIKFNVIEDKETERTVDILIE